MDGLRKGREILGLPVISLATGKEIGIVNDLVWCPHIRKITYILLDETGILHQPRFIRYHDVTNIGKDAITVAVDSLPEGETKPQDSPRVTQITGVPVLTTEGENLGTVEDVVFAVEDGELLGCEISGGLFEDLISGRSILPWDAVVTWGEETIIVKDAVAEPGRESGAVPHLPE